MVLKLVFGCVSKFSVGHIQTGCTYLLPLHICGRSWQGCQFLWFHLPSSIHWLDSSQFLKLIVTGFKSIVSWFYCWSLLNLFSGVGEALIYKHHQWWLRVGLSGTKSHWVIPSHISYLSQVNHLKIVRPRGTESHLVHPLQIFTVCKAINSREWAQGALRPILFIPWNISYWMQVNNLRRDGPRGNKAHLVHPLYFFTGCKAIISIE